MRAPTRNSHSRHKLASSRTQPPFRRSAPAPGRPVELASQRLFRMFLIPCSCGTTFSVAENYDRQGSTWSRYLICPGCGKHHDPKNRLLQMGFHWEGYWKIDDC